MVGVINSDEDKEPIWVNVHDVLRPAGFKVGNPVTAVAFIDDFQLHLWVAGLQEMMDIPHIAISQWFVKRIPAATIRDAVTDELNCLMGFECYGHRYLT